MRMLNVFVFFLLFLGIKAAAPVFAPSTYSATVGLNTTIGTTIASLSYTFSDPNEVVTLSVDAALDGYTYFGFSGNDVILVNRLDVEYGGTQWTARILAIDNGTTPETGTATLSLTTYESTTTTTTTPAPPGYSWFNEDENVILFGSFFGFMALLTGACVLMCFRFHRIGTCLPRSCPEYRQCRASAGRQCDCCPIPCTYTDHVPIEKEDEFTYNSRETTSSLSRQVGLSEITEQPVSTMASTQKDKSISSKESRPPKGPPLKRSVTPVSIGNIDLRQAGFDGMRSPGFNAPMFTSYGGSSGAASHASKSRRKRQY